MNLLDLAPGFDDPVEALLGFHRRIERQLAALGSLPCHLEAQGVDARASASAAAIVEFFSASIAVHHADEEALLPLLEMRAAGPEGDEVRELRERLEAEHREMERTWRALHRPLAAIAEGMQRRLPPDLVQYFRASHSAHISLEESRLHLAAARRLLPADRAALGRGMVARRTRRYRAS